MITVRCILIQNLLHNPALPLRLPSMASYIFPIRDPILFRSDISDPTFFPFGVSVQLLIEYQVTPTIFRYIIPPYCNIDVYNPQKNMAKHCTNDIEGECFWKRCSEGFVPFP